MSSPAEGSGSGSERPSGFSRLIRRTTKALRPRSQRPGPAQEPILPATESRTVSVPRPAAPASRPLLPSEPPPPHTNSETYMAAREAKARQLFAKYGLSMSASEWSAPALPRGSQQPPWVEKHVVMRVRRVCHRCQTPFGADKLCVQCAHTRCKKCPRFPTKVPREMRPGGEKFDPSLAGALVVDPAYKGKGRLVPLVVSRGEGKRDAVRKHPVHRVRRTCHRCEALFVGKATVCAGCGHQRCPQCPRDPPKLKKWPNGYPGDVEEQFPLAQRVPKNIRTRFRWECHTCQKVFIEHEKVCRGCQHERCEQCPRKPPKKTKKVPDPAVVRSVEERMARMSIVGEEAEGS